MGRHHGLIQRLARLASLDELDGEVPKGAIQDVLDEATIILPIDAVIDLAAISNDPSGELDPDMTLSINHRGRARVARMARAGLVARRRGAVDGRLTEVALTAEGARTFAQIRPLALAHADRALAGLSDRDIATFRRVARHVLGNIEAVDKERGAGDMPAPQ